MKYIQFNSNIIKLSILIFFFSFTGSCTKEDINVVPIVPVNLQLSMTSELASMAGTGSLEMLVTITPDSTRNNGVGWSIVNYHDKNLGKFSINQATYNNGIVLYHASWGEYFAFDLTCPYNAFVSKPNGDCALTIEQGIYLPSCPCCKSRFNLENDLSPGFPVDGSKARHSLLPYKVNFSQDGLTMYVSK
jgi:hypothetical protein